MSLAPPPTSLGLTNDLVMPALVWEPTIRELLRQGPGHYAVGSFRRQPAAGGERLLVEQLTVQAGLPSGADHSVLADWFLLHFEQATFPFGWSAAELIRRLAPGKSQSLAVLVVSPGSQAGETGNAFWDGALTVGPPSSTSLVPLDSCRIPGPGLLKLVRQAPLPLLSLEEHERYSRTIGSLGSATHHKLRDLSVTLVGAGRNGSQLAAQLASLGVGHLRLVDPDQLEAHNLDASPLFRSRDIGQAKVQALGKRLRVHRPDLRVSCLAQSVTSAEVITALRGLPSDVLISCVDSDTPRLSVSLLARETLTPHLDVGTHLPRDSAEMHGDARLLLPMQGCTRCVGGYANSEQTMYEIAAPPGVMQRGELPRWDQQRAGSLVTLNAITVGAGVQLLLDLIGGSLRTSRWQRFTWRAGQGLDSQSAAVGAAPACPLCG